MATALLDDWAPLHHQQSSSSSVAASTAQSGGPQQQQKKPRHRHSPEQLAALNELFDKNEHPPLEARTALAERLGMEVKTVNSWYQNKRSSCSKRRRTQTNDGSTASHLNPSQVSIPAPPPPLSAATTPGAHHRDLDEDDHHPSHSVPGHFSPLQKVSHAAKITPGSSNSSSASFFATNPDLHYFGSSRDSPDPTSMSRKMRMRPTAEQTKELKKLYSITPRPTSEERQALAERIGMRYESINNWMQNQRSKSKHIEPSNPKHDYSHHHGDERQYSAFPPRPPHQIHPSLVSDSAALPLPSLSSSTEGAGAPRSPSVSPSMDEQYSRRRNMRRSTTPYGGPMQSRPRRSRPEPYQLDALKGLFTRTSTPTIEERSALALEIGMDVGKVTNWFRNLRQSQTARKRRNNMRNGYGDEQDAHGIGSASGEEDDDMQDQLLGDESPQYSSAVSRSASRAGTPSRFSSASSSSLGERELEARMRRQIPHSNIPSEDDDYPEAVTPENGRSPSPRLERRAMHSSKPMHPRELLPPPSQMLVDHRDPYPSSSSPYPQHPFYLPPPSFPPNQHYSGPLPPMNIPSRLPQELKSSLGLGRFNAAVSLSEPSFYPKQHAHPYLDEDPIRCAKAAERFGIKLEDAYLLLDFKFHRQ